MTFAALMNGGLQFRFKNGGQLIVPGIIIQSPVGVTLRLFPHRAKGSIPAVVRHISRRDIKPRLISQTLFYYGLNCHLRSSMMHELFHAFVYV